MTGKRITPTERAIIKAAYRWADMYHKRPAEQYDRDISKRRHLGDAVIADMLSKRGKR